MRALQRFGSRLTLGAGLALLLWVCVMALRTAWWVAGKPTRGTAELADQAQVLASAVGVVIGITTAVATVAYVVLTHHLVKQGQVDAADRRRSEERVAIDSLAGGALTAVVQSVIVARGLKPGVTVRFRGDRRSRETVLLAGFVRSTDALSDATRWGESVKSLRPDLMAEVDAVLDVATGAFDDAMRGRVSSAEGAAATARTAIDALHEAAVRA